MIDRPTPAKILLTLADKKSTGEEFIALATTLYRRNLIFEEPRELRRNKDVLELTVIFRDHDSFKYWTWDSEIKKYWNKKFDTLVTSKPKTIKEKDVIIEIDDVRNCVCEKSDYLILEGRSYQWDELTCNNCLNQISYAKVPLEIEIEDWQVKYQRVYGNWIESGLFEKEALKELTNYKKGKLNLEGEKIRKQLADFFKIPVYINYFVEEVSIDYPCLICGQQGTESGLHYPVSICKTCNTIFGYKEE